MRPYRVVGVLALLSGALPAIASAHAFGQQYTLPLPFPLYVTGAVCALFASFAITALYSAPTPFTGEERPTGKIISISPRLHVGFWSRLFGVLIFFATVSVAFLGDESFTTNPVPDLFWGALLLGLTYASALCAGLWQLMNPFDTIVRGILLSRGSTSLFQYPSQLGYWPAFTFYYLLIWFELLSSGAGAIPAVIGDVLLGYLLLSVIGVKLWGREAWFTYCDFFSVFFGIIERFAPLVLRPTEITVRLPGEDLVHRGVSEISQLVFILFMLSSTAFDGLQDTRVWWDVMYSSIAQIVLYFEERTVVLLVSPFIFLVLYGCAVYGMRFITRSQRSFRELLLRFVPLLVPIAIAYSFAHYFTLLVNSLQSLYALASDPLGWGWDLFGTAAYQVNIGLISAQAIWYTQFAAILIGHSIATYIAHGIALKEFSTRKQILLGQLPMLMLMVFYTVFGLWILSQAYQVV